MSSDASTPDIYVAELPEDRKAIIQALREAIKANLPKGFEEVMQYGMICYVVPLSIYPKGYHTTPNTPLPFMSVASQKNHVAVYHMDVAEGDLLTWLLAEWGQISKKKLDIGKSCIRFKNIKDIPVPLMGELANKMTVKSWIDRYEQQTQK